jgi:hypothetical protein
LDCGRTLLVFQGNGVTNRHSRRFCAILTVAAIAAIAGNACAGEPAGARFTATGGTVVHPNLNCTCRLGGENYQIGDAACIRGKMATCAMFLNNTSWAMSGSPCPIADYSPALRLAWHG